MGRWVKVTDYCTWSEQNSMDSERNGGKVLMRVVAHCSLSNRDRADVVLEIKRSGARSEWSDYLKVAVDVFGEMSCNATIEESQGEVRFHRADCPQVLPFKRQSRALIGTGA